MSWSTSMLVNCVLILVIDQWVEDHQVTPNKETNKQREQNAEMQRRGNQRLEMVYMGIFCVTERLRRFGIFKTLFLAAIKLFAYVT
jgi:hypothetical protein